MNPQLSSEQNPNQLNTPAFAPTAPKSEADLPGVLVNSNLGQASTLASNNIYQVNGQSVPQASSNKSPKTKFFIVLAIILLMFLIGAGLYLVFHKSNSILHNTPNQSSADLYSTSSQLSSNPSYNRIVFSTDKIDSSGAQTSQTYSANPDGSGQKTLPASDLFAQAAAEGNIDYHVSPDGKHIVYLVNNRSTQSATAANEALYIVSSDGSEKNTVQTIETQYNGEGVGNIAWSPDSEYFAYDWVKPDPSYKQTGDDSQSCRTRDDQVCPNTYTIYSLSGKKNTNLNLNNGDGSLIGYKDKYHLMFITASTDKTASYFVYDLRSSKKTYSYSGTNNIGFNLQTSFNTSRTDVILSSSCDGGGYCKMFSLDNIGKPTELSLQQITELGPFWAGDDVFYYSVANAILPEATYPRDNKPLINPYWGAKASDIYSYDIKTGKSVKVLSSTAGTYYSLVGSTDKYLYINKIEGLQTSTSGNDVIFNPSKSKISLQAINISNDNLATIDLQTSTSPYAYVHGLKL